MAMTPSHLKDNRKRAVRFFAWPLVLLIHRYFVFLLAALPPTRQIPSDLAHYYHIYVSPARGIERRNLKCSAEAQCHTCHAGANDPFSACTAEPPYSIFKVRCFRRSHKYQILSILLSLFCWGMPLLCGTVGLFVFFRD